MCKYDRTYTRIKECLMYTNFQNQLTKYSFTPLNDSVYPLSIKESCVWLLGRSPPSLPPVSIKCLTYQVHTVRPDDNQSARQLNFVPVIINVRSIHGYMALAFQVLGRPSELTYYYSGCHLKEDCSGLPFCGLDLGI